MGGSTVVDAGWLIAIVLAFLVLAAVAVATRRALIERGPCAEHRRRYVNVRAAAAALRGEQLMRDNVLDETDVEIARLG